LHTKGKWRVITNQVKSYGIKYDQHTRIEEREADAAGKAFLSMPTCYESNCLEKNIYHCLLVYDPTDYYFPFSAAHRHLQVAVRWSFQSLVVAVVCTVVFDTDSLVATAVGLTDGFNCCWDNRRCSTYRKYYK
jgi:hypothetical protein